MSVLNANERRDRLPLWVIALLILFLTLRVFNLQDMWAAKQGGRLSQSLNGQVDEKTMSATIAANWAAKTAFVSSVGQPGGAAAPDRKALREALKDAETLQTDSHNAPSMARRVIILRALLRLPLLTAGKNGLNPGLAFQPAALAGLPPEDKSRYAAEGRVWADVARGPHLTPAQTASEAALLRSLPNIRWWLYPALAVLYESQGNAAAAGRYNRQAQTQALLTMGPLILLALLWGALGMAGAALLIYLGIRKAQARDPAAAPLPNLWPVLPETIPLADRRLRAGDLMGVFVLYLLMPDLLGWLLAGFHIPHLLYFGGLLSGDKPRLAALPASRHVAAIVVLEFVAYLFSAALPITILVALARRRGASLGLELGWNRLRLGANLLYGVGGYALALPLMFLASAPGPQINRHAPAPSNPAIPLLANASLPWVQALLVLLATVAAPLTEELLFRGVFYNAAKLRAGVWPAIILTGLVFGFAHPVGIAEMLPLAVLGGVFAWMAETRKSLAPSILAHCLQNTMATLILLLALGG